MPTCQEIFLVGIYFTLEFGMYFCKMNQDRHNLRRFIQAQDFVFPTVLKELQSGRKRSHWMWFIFPQLKHLGHSHNARFYGISGLDEARTYLDDAVLGERLRRVAMTILELPTDDAVEVFGGIDSMKLRSCMTLFDMVSPGDIFARVLDKYFDGRRDNITIEYLNIPR